MTFSPVVFVRLNDHGCCSPVLDSVFLYPIFSYVWALLLSSLPVMLMTVTHCFSWHHSFRVFTYVHDTYMTYNQ